MSQVKNTVNVSPDVLCEQPGQAVGEPQKIWNPAFISVFIANMMMFLGQQMMNTLIAKYADYLGATPTLVGVVASAFAYTAILFKIIAAPALDTFNKKYLLTSAILVIATAFFGYSLSDSIPVMIACRLLQGAGMAFSATACLALASDALPADKMGTGIGYYSLAQAACMAIGPTIGLFLADKLGYNPTFAIGAAVMLIAAFAASRIKNDFKKVKKFRISVENIVAKEAILPAVLMFFLCMAYYNVNSFLVIYAEDRGVTANIGYFFTVYAVTLLFSRPMVGKLADRYGVIRILIPAMFFFAAAFLLISFSYTIWMFLIAAFISALGYGACQPLVQTLCMKSVPKRDGEQEAVPITSVRTWETWWGRWWLARWRRLWGIHPCGVL